MKKLFTIAAIALALSACATTETAATKKSDSLDVAKTTVEKKDKKKYICKVIKKTGTNFKKRQCWAKEEYAEMQKRSREDIERFKRSNMDTKR